METKETVYLVACVNKKKSKPTTAQDLYDSELFRRMRSYVETSHCPWFILSAKYGLVCPDKVIDPYNETLNTLGVAARRAWAERVQLQMDKFLPTTSKIVVFAGRRYREFLMPYLRRHASVVEVPLEDSA